MSSKTIIAVAKMYGKGRVQFPKEVREILNLKDGDKIYFIHHELGIIVEKAPKLKREKMGRYTVTVS